MHQGWRHVELVSRDSWPVGRVSSVLWRDASGFYIVAVGEHEFAVAVPVKASEWAGKIVVAHTAEQVLRGPLLQQLAARGGEEAIKLVSRHYNIPLSGPPPGPGTQKLPPWWGKKPEGEPESSFGEMTPEAILRRLAQLRLAQLSRALGYKTPEGEPESSFGELMPAEAIMRLGQLRRTLGEMTPEARLRLAQTPEARLRLAQLREALGDKTLEKQLRVAFGDQTQEGKTILGN
jgi:hypothetical protein